MTIIQKGTVVRMANRDGQVFAFSDCLVTNVYDEKGTLYADLVRPYVLDSGEHGVENVKHVPYRNLVAPHWVIAKR